jgi:Sec-independent protein translocase protein TatA
VKFLFSPAGLIVIAVLAFILFFPRRPAEKLRKFGKPMRAFPDEPPSIEAPAAGGSRESEGSAGRSASDSG